jgi:hypothetical protein
MVNGGSGEMGMQAITGAGLTNLPADRFRAGDRRMLDAGSVPGFPALLPGNMQCSSRDRHLVIRKRPSNVLLSLDNPLTGRHSGGMDGITQIERVDPFTITAWQRRQRADYPTASAVP